ncbi:hypothetical protein QTJ16_006918 [Diplocarpon rosae]|uniref:Uncharacterized protein n=1 Tax=Diplocarpon rosae TaxID=946125 RepID=A0AAD9SVH4_9HELO|nr:hypothetical protein QTJ16_006918 [Diplocarpon rosae]
MVSRAPTEGDTTGTKRGAAEDLEQQGPKQRDTSEEEAIARDAYGHEIPPYPPVALTHAERVREARRTAAYIDAATAQRRAADEKAKFDVENPTFAPGITSRDPRWVEKRASFVEKLQSQAIKDVLEDAGITDRAERDASGEEIFRFGKYRYLQLMPPSADGIVLDTQRENASMYREALQSARFRGVHDNLATKLTMLHFGLPIEPITMNNILFSDQDRDDEPDAPPEPPQVQRIIYSEKPLEFLDSYHERSYGYPMLRRPKYTRQAKPPAPQDTPPVPNLSSVVPALPSGVQPRIRARLPIQPSGTALGMRGGAGTTRVLYNHYGGSKVLSLSRSTQLVSAAEFRDAALDLLQLHPDSNWVIVFDQFNNSERFKDDLQKKFVRSFEVTKDNFQNKFDAYLQARISNKEDDWILVAAYKHLRLPGGEKSPATFALSSSTETRGSLPDAKFRPPFSPTAGHLPAPPTAAPSAPPAGPTPVISPPGPRRKIYHYKGPASSLASDGSDEATFEDSAAALEEAIERLMRKTRARWIVSITMYSTDGNRTASITFPSGASETVYRQFTSFAADSSAIVCHEPTITAPAQWPRTRQPKPPRAEAPIYHLNSSLGRRVKDDARDFLTQALSLLGLDASDDDWEFYVGVYADETKEDAEARSFRSEFRVNKDTAADIYSSRIRDFLFDRFQDYHVTVRTASGRGLRRFDSKKTDFGVPPPPGATQAQAPRRSLWDPPLLKDHIYAYGGTCPVENLTSGAFISASLALLGLYEGDDWQFFVETYDHGGRQSEWARWTKTGRNAERFKQEILPRRNSGDGAWPVFVRRTNVGPSAGALQPPGDQTDVCRLRMSDGRTAYWKLPSPASRNYGINQVQNDFFSAMRVFFPRGKTRPEERISIHGFDLGIGGMEITQSLWDRVVGDVQRGTTARGYRVDKISARNNSIVAPTQFFRVPGTVRHGQYVVGDYADLAAKILVHSTSILELKNLDPAWGIWQRGTSNVVTARPPAPNPPITTPNVHPSPAVTKNLTANSRPSTSPVKQPVKQPPYTRTSAPLPPGHRRQVPRSEFVPLFDSWMTEQHAQDSLQHRSWTQDQSVIEPGNKLETPFFGDILELPLTVGPNLPTVFAQHLTPTDIAQLLRDRRKAVNHVLERETACPICSEVFASYDNDKKKRHYEQHTEQINAGRVCPLCEDANWRFWTLSQKRDHLINDQNEQVKAEITAFWSVTRCPICNEEFRDMTAEQVIAHLAAHIPGVLKFCDRCGLDISSCTPAETSHHDKTCIFVAERQPNVDWLCNVCGREDKPGHESTHPASHDPRAPFCVRCGLSLANLDEATQEDHGSRCKRPCGPSAVFCRRCGIDLLSLDALGFAAHNNECYRREPASVAGSSLANVAKAKAIERQRIQNARDLTELKRQRAELAQRKDILDKRETDLRAQENLVVDRLVALADLGSCPFPSCSVDLGTGNRMQLLGHLRFHAGATSSAAAEDAGFPCDTDELLKALAEFKKRMPDFRAAHTALNALASQTLNNMKGPNPTPNSPRTETRSLARRNPDDAMRDANNRYVQARIDAARVREAGDAAVQGALDATVAAERGKEDDAKRLAKQQGGKDQKAAGDAEPARGASSTVTTNPPPEQSGFLPSPPRGSANECRSLRKSRSVRGRAPTTAHKRKKAAMDDSEDTLSGWPSIQRSPSKRESKKMKTSNQLRSPDKRRRGVMNAGGGDRSSEFDGEAQGMVTAPKRVTRAASAAPRGEAGTGVAPPRGVGRPKKVAAVEAEDDGFEDVEEEDEEEEGLASLVKKSPGKT